MDPAAYLAMAETESRHWWFSGRRAILAKTIEQLRLSKNSDILEVGCGTGGNLPLLAAYGRVSALESDERAREIASIRTRNFCDVRPGRCPDQIPFVGQRFDLICLLDVLEHIDDDAGTLVSMKGFLAAGGRIVVTVPAYQWLYGSHDKYIHHKRRYSAMQLRRLFQIAGFRPVKLTYFNTILFPLAALVRLKANLSPDSPATLSHVPPAFLNWVLESIFSAERHLLPHTNLPFGLSLLAILELG